MSERLEALVRILVAIVTGIILYFWAFLVGVLIIINFVWTIISGKRVKEIAEMCENWNTQKYIYFRYVQFLNNERPFPFNRMTKNISKFSKK